MSPSHNHSIRQIPGPSRAWQYAALAFPIFAALGISAQQVQAGILKLDFAKTLTPAGVAGVDYATGWNPIFVPQQQNTQVNAANVGGSGYGFAFANVASYDNGSAAQPLTRSGFYTYGNSGNAHGFAVTGLNPNLPVKLYACAAWDGNSAGGYVVYGDNAPAGVRAQTVGTPGTSPTVANLTYIGTATADGTGMVSGALYGRNQITTGYAEGQVGAFMFVPTQTITASAGTHGSISASGVSNAYADATPSYTITADSGYHVADVLVNGVSVGAVTSYTFSSGVATNSTIAASFAADTTSYTITASAGANGSISPIGAVTVFGGVNLPFTITANTGYHIADVLVDGSSVGAVATYTFSNVAASHTIAASFAVNTYAITATAGANGTISPNGQAVNYGDSPTFTITPASGYYIADVKVDGVNLGAIETYTFDAVTATHTITASFDNRTRVYLDLAKTGGAYTSGWNPAFATQQADTMVSITSVGGLGYNFTFDHVASYDNGDTAQSLTRSGFFNFGNIANAHPFTLTGLIPGQVVGLYACAAWDGNAKGGYVVFGDSGATGVKAQTIGSPGNGPALDNLTLIGTATTDANGIVSGTMHGANGVGTASEGQIGGFVFALQAPPIRTITASAGAHGSISPSGAVSVTSGSSQEFTVTANSGYHVMDILVDGNSVGAQASYTFSNVLVDHTISATFAVNTVSYTLNASAGFNGTINPSGPMSVFQGVNQPYSITPDVGYHVANVLVDGNSAGAVTGYTFTNVQANHTISASFAIDTFTITASSGAHGSISPNGVTTVDYDGSQSFTITPASGYYIADLKVDGVPVGTSETYTFDYVVTNHTIAATFDNRTRLYLDFAQNGGGTTSGWTSVYCNSVGGAAPQDTMVNVANVGGSAYGFAADHVSGWDANTSGQPLTRSGFFNYGGITNTHAFGLTGLASGQAVHLYACAGWDGNARGATLVFGDSGAAGVRAQTLGNPGYYPTLENLTLIGTATADGTGTVTGNLQGAGGVNSATEGQVGGFVFVLEAAAPIVDVDADGMDDNWENSYFGSTNETATGDFDHDGTNNITEFRLGLIPNSGSSMFAASLNNDGLIQWTSAVGVTFSIERSTTLAAGSWTVLEASFPGTAGTASYTDPEPPAGHAYYRVKLNP
ncbi:MAG: hypothetical protein ABIS50_17150 [Luteolibacter sp.]